MEEDQLLFESLEKFYQRDYARHMLSQVLGGDANISLRSVDWFITNYTKKMNIYYQVYKDSEGDPCFGSGDFDRNVNVHHSYKSQLKAYSKRRFDPFCRRKRISFDLGKYGSVDTTIGQLNFFRWAIDNLVVQYLQDHREDIENDMNECLKNIKYKSQKKSGSRKQREELSLSATRGLSRNRISVCLTFD